MLSGQPNNYLELQRQLSLGSQEALKSLYDGAGSKLFQFAYSIVHSKEIAEEVIQDVFLEVWKNRQKFATIENLKLYLYICTRNMSITHLRKSNKHRSFSLDEIKLPFLKVESTPEDLFITGEMLHRINFAINNLPLQCRLIFKLVKEDGFKYREVAELMQISQKTVENQMGIAIRKITASFRTHFQDKKSSTG